MHAAITVYSNGSLSLAVLNSPKLPDNFDGPPGSVIVVVEITDFFARHAHQIPQPPTTQGDTRHD